MNSSFWAWDWMFGVVVAMFVVVECEAQWVNGRRENDMLYRQSECRREVQESRYRARCRGINCQTKSQITQSFPRTSFGSSASLSAL